MTDTNNTASSTPLTGNEAITKAEEIAASTSGLNIPAPVSYTHLTLPTKA